MRSEKLIKKQIKKIENELQEEPDNHTLLNDLGVGYYLVGEYQKATVFLKSAVEINQKNSTYLFNLANAYSELENYPIAIKFYLDALELKPGHIPSLTNLADCYEISGDIENAKELFSYITKLAPENALAFFNLGNFLLRQNNHNDAVKNYEEAIRLEASFVDAYYNITWILTEIKAFKEALVYAKKGLAVDSSHSELREILRKIRRNIR